jgi:hypothetical protein
MLQIPRFLANPGHAISLVLALSASACQSPEDSGPLQIVGRNRVGDEVRMPLASRVAASQLTRSLRRLDRSTAALLSSGEVSGGFELKRVTVGLELELEGEIENVIELGGEGALELRYERLPL